MLVEKDVGELHKMVKNLKKVNRELSVLKNGNIILTLGNSGCGKSTLLASLIYGPESLEEKQIDI